MARAEDQLDKGWIVGDIKPTGGAISNYRLGLFASVDAASASVRQDDLISPDHLIDQSCKLFELLFKVFEIRSIRVPTFRALYQIAAETTDETDSLLNKLQLCAFDQSLLNNLGGELGPTSFVVTTREMREFGELPVQRKLRLEGRGVRQHKQAPFDQRLIQRTSLLSIRERDAVRGLLQLRKMHATRSVDAIEFDAEYSFEEPEFLVREFALEDFMREGNQKIVEIAQAIERRVEEVIGKK